MASVLKRNYGNQDWNLGEQRFARLHIYPTLAALNADVSTAQGRAAFCIETDRTYFGKSGAWIGLANSSSFQDPVANVGALPPTDTTGTVRVVLNDGSGVGPTLWMYSAAAPVGWHKIGDPRIILSDGTVKFTAIPGVASGAVVPVAPTDLVTKAYADVGAAGLATHIADPNAHSAEINSVVSSAVTTHNANAGAHQPEINNAVAAGVAPVQAQLTSHLTDGAAHAAAIAAAVNSAISTHDGNPTAHSAEIAAAIAAHDANASSHAAGIAGPASGGGGGGGGGTSSSGGADGAFSRSGQNILENARVVSGGHGSPCFTDPFESVYKKTGALDEPVGVIWRPSTQTAYPSGPIVFSTGNIQMPSTAGLSPGMVVLFPGAVAVGNAGVYFTVTNVVDGTNVSVLENPSPESVASTMTAFALDGIVVFAGRMTVDNPLSVALAVPITAIIANDGGGHGEIQFASSGFFSGIREGDSITLVGTASNDGIYTIRTTISATNKISVTVPLIAAGAAGTADVNHPGQANNFSTFSVGQSDTPFFADPSNALRYSTTPGKWRLGTQINDNDFVVRIDEIYIPPAPTPPPTIPYDIPQWKKFTFTYAALAVAALTNTIEMYQLPAAAIIHAVRIKHSVPFTGGAISAYSLSVGVFANLTKYALAFDVFQPISGVAYQDSFLPGSESFTGAISLRLAAQATGANLDQATAGTVDVWVLLSKAN